MFEQLIIGLIFVAALAYLGRNVWKALFRKEAGCSKGCGCSADVKPSVTNKRAPLQVK